MTALVENVTLNLSNFTLPYDTIDTLVAKLKTQKGIVIEQKVIPGANHFFDSRIEPLMESIGVYLDKRLQGERRE